MRLVWVYPENDRVAHDVESDDCICGPTVEFLDEGTMLSHHSLDGRERIEELPWFKLWYSIRRLLGRRGGWTTEWEEYA